MSSLFQAVKAVVLSWGDLAPQGTFGNMSETFLVTTLWGWQGVGAGMDCGFWWVGAWDAAKYSTQQPPTQNAAPKGEEGVVVEKPLGWRTGAPDTGTLSMTIFFLNF